MNSDLNSLVQIALCKQQDTRDSDKVESKNECSESEGEADADDDDDDDDGEHDDHEDKHTDDLHKTICWFH